MTTFDPTLPSLRNRSVLASVTFNKPQMTKSDAKATRDAEDAANAKRAGVFIKKLYPQELLAPIIAIENAAREYLRSKSLTNVMVDGLFIMPVSNVLDVSDVLHRNFFVQRRQAVTVFAQNWARVMAEQQANLGSMFDIHAYPDASEVVEQFTSHFHILPIGALGDGLFDDIEAEIREEVTARVSMSTQKLARDAAVQPISRLLDAVANLYDKLARDGSRLHAPTVDAVREISEALPSLNQLNIPAIDNLVATIGDRLNVSLDMLKARDSQVAIDVMDVSRALLTNAGIKPDDVLGLTKKERKDTALAAANSIMDSMRGFM